MNARLLDRESRLVAVFCLDRMNEVALVRLIFVGTFAGTSESKKAANPMGMRLLRLLLAERTGDSAKTAQT